MGHELYVHVTGSAHGDATGLSLQIEDTVCLQCHDPARRLTTRNRIVIDHEDHARRNRSCISCHINTSHPDPRKERSLVMMGQCFECHGAASTPTAPRECESCHPRDFDLVPQSHKPKVWQTSHGKVARDDLPQCQMCHTGELCSDCHGLVMPHPEMWKAGDLGHAALKKSDGAVCVKCHDARPEPCSTCHHSAHNPRRGPWALTHLFVVRAGGAAQCMDCHATDFCKECHDARLQQLR